MIPLSAKQVAQITEGKLIGGNPDALITGVSIDSRTIHPGDIFVAFHGARVDGHQFVPQALQQATAALIQHPVDLTGLALQSRAVILVTNPLEAVQILAKHERSRFSGPVIGVTGSNGKTTTKDMIATVFATAGPTLATKGNLNTELGLPLTLLRRLGNENSMVLEMGMRGLGQIADLCEIAQPTAGIITNIGQSHLELLGSQENIALAKAELLEALSMDGFAALAKGDVWLERMAIKSRAPVFWYGLESSADAFASNLESTTTGTRFQANVLSKQVSVELTTRGQHNVSNAMGALLLGSLYGLNLPAMADALRELPPSVGRLRVLKGQRDCTVIDDCYNASPLSMKASLRVLMEQAHGAPTVAILGDMFELGDYEQPGHFEVGEFTAEIGVTTVIAVGERARWIADGAKSAGQKSIESFETKEELLSQLNSLVPTGATILVKASRGMALEQIVSALTS